MRKILFLFAVTGWLLTACNNSGSSDTTKKDSTMSSSTSSAGSDKEAKDEKNKATAMANINAAIAHDANAMFKDCTPDFVEYSDESSSPVKGLDSAKASFQKFLDAFPDLKGEDLHPVSDGNWVIVWGKWTGTFKKDFMGMKPTNKAFSVHDVDIFKFNDAGKMTEHHSVQSGSTYMMQVGAKM